MDKSDDFASSGAWDINQLPPNIRLPRDSPNAQPATTPSCKTASGGGDSGPVLKPHLLSAEAKEFVPRSAQTFSTPVAPQESTGISDAAKALGHHAPFVPKSYQPAKKQNLQSRLTRYQNANGTESQQETTNTHTQHNYEDPGNTNYAVRRLNEYMNEIIVKPGRFDALARMLVEESVSWFEDSGVASKVVDAIVSQAIIERNFQYNGARLCSLLSSELDTSETPVFKNHLFERVKQEYTKILPDVEKQPSKVFGFVGFLAELYSQMGNADESHSLGKYFLNIVEILVSNPSAESIKRVCQLLKLTGGMLDKENKPKVESVIEKLAKAGYKTNTTNIVGSVITLREQNWGEEVGEGADAVIDSSLSGQPCLQSEAIQYGPDGVALSKEESEFLHASSNAPDDGVDLEEADDFGDEYAPYDDDEMDEEMQKGFLEFLIESKQF